MIKLKRFVLCLMLNIFTVVLFSGCDSDNDNKFVNRDHLVGEWTYVATHEKQDGKWEVMHSQNEVDGFIRYETDGSAFISMTYGGQTQTLDFQWELRPNGDYINNGIKRGTIAFESIDKFYIYSFDTVDPNTGQTVEGDFRDTFIRKK